MREQFHLLLRHLVYNFLISLFHSQNGDGPRVRNQCPANQETNVIFPHPGTIYPYPLKDYNSSRKAYEVPLRENVGEGLDDSPLMCNLASDP